MVCSCLWIYDSICAWNESGRKVPSPVFCTDKRLFIAHHSLSFNGLSSFLSQQMDSKGVEVMGLESLSRKALVVVSNDKRIIVPPVRGRIKRKIFSLLYKKLKFVSQHAVHYILSNSSTVSPWIFLFLLIKQPLMW